MKKYILKSTEYSYKNFKHGSVHLGRDLDSSGFWLLPKIKTGDKGFMIGWIFWSLIYYKSKYYPNVFYYRTSDIPDGVPEYNKEYYFEIKVNSNTNLLNHTDKNMYRLGREGCMDRIKHEYKISTLNPISRKEFTEKTSILKGVYIIKMTLELKKTY